MLQALDIKKGMRVLEVGAGSGYNAALLQELVGDSGLVVSTEVVQELVMFATNNLKKIKSKAVVVHHDGSKGYVKEAPYDRIIVVAGAPSIPHALIEQLKEGGIMIIPVGKGTQVMIKGVKKNGKLLTEELGAFVFVPLREGKV
jgi:protein-L-isoaspartate(D-aspartate) O-methyltransferase